jgi:hypothetical protein
MNPENLKLENSNSHESTTSNNNPPRKYSGIAEMWKRQSQVHKLKTGGLA